MDYKDFIGIEKELEVYGLSAGLKLQFQLPNALETLKAAMQYFVGESLTWLPEYDKVAEWLTDNQGKGLLLYGNNGVGKTVLCQKAIPAIFLKYHRKIITHYDYNDLNTKADEILAKRLLAIDDFGCEEQGVIYGNKRWVLPEVMDQAEKRNNLILLTSNLKGEQIANKYGARTFDRMLSTTVRIEIKHKSFRG